MLMTYNCHISNALSVTRDRSVVFSGHSGFLHN